MITGGCLCRAVRFGFTAPAVATRACWCRDCQYLAAGNATNNAIFAVEGFACTGEVREYVSKAASGTPLFSFAANRPTQMVVRVGALDDPTPAAPECVIWTASAPEWAHIEATMPQSPGQKVSSADLVGDMDGPPRSPL